MVETTFLHVLECIQSAESILTDVLTGDKGLHLSDICFALSWHTMNMQRITLAHLKGLIDSGSCQPEGCKEDVYSSSMAILIIFISVEAHEKVEHVHLGMVICCVGSHLAHMETIKKFITSIENDLKSMRERCHQGKDTGGARSYSILVANYRGTLVLPMELPYCLVYPMVYAENAEEFIFNTSGGPSMMHTLAYACRSLLSHLVKKSDGSCVIIPCSMHFDCFLPEITISTVTPSP